MNLLIWYINDEFDEFFDENLMNYVNEKSNAEEFYPICLETFCEKRKKKLCLIASIFFPKKCALEWTEK